MSGPVIYTDGVHLIVDGDDFAALHRFAARLGLRRCWFQGDHYDLTTRGMSLLLAAVAAGAVLIDGRDLGRVTIRNRRRKAKAPPARLDAPWLSDDWAPVPLDPALTADKNTELMRRFAPGRRVGRRGGEHL